MSGLGYILWVPPGNCQLGNSARWGLQRLNETKKSRKVRKTAFLLAPGHLAVRLVSFAGWLAGLPVVLLSFLRAGTEPSFAAEISEEEQVETIRLADALARMEAAKVPFTLRFVTYDAGRKTGGRVVEWENCRLAAKSEGHPFRYPTRNLLVGESMQRRKVHIWLLLALDGQRIMLG